MANETANPSYEEAYQKLLASYVKRLESSLDAIQDILTQGQLGRLTGDDLQRAQHLAHGLAGSGTTFGFPEITEAGRKADAFLTRLLHLPASETGKIYDEDFRELEKLMRDLYQACSSAIFTT